MERLNPEQRARRRIDAQLAEAGWLVQHRDELNLAAAQGIAVRELPLNKGHGKVDYLLFVDRQPVGVLEAKAEDYTLTSVEPQAKLYAGGLQYVSTGSVTLRHWSPQAERSRRP